MKKSIRVLACLMALLVVSSTAAFAKTQLYALDGRTIYVEDNQIEVYTAPGMGWYKEKPVTMYAADGRTLIVPADQVEAHKNVGWYLEGELEKEETSPKEEESALSDNEKPAEITTPSETVKIKYTDGTTVTVPSKHVETYKLLGWSVVGEASDDSQQVTYVTLYHYDGSTKEVAESEIEKYKASGWAIAYDEAVYTFATKGDGGDNPGAVALLEQKKYEQAFNAVQDAILKIENTESEYVTWLYYLRSEITDTWREAANSPLGFINYWFTDKDGKKIIVFEYRNVSNSSINLFKINFDICDKDGKVIETNDGSYFVNNLQMLPCEKKRVGWAIESGSEAVSIKNLKVMEVSFSDGTKWAASK